MMGTLSTFVRQGKVAARSVSEQRWVRQGGELLLYGLSGFALSAAALGGGYLSIVPGILCTIKGIPAAMIAAGGLLGYRVFWGSALTQAALWILLSLGVGIFLSGKPRVRSTPLLLPAIAGLILSASGVAFQIFFRDNTSIPLYFLRVGVAAGTAWLSLQTAQSRTTVTDSLIGALVTLALAQVWLPGEICLGLICAGFLSVNASFPGVILAGVALDLAQAVPIPMTAALCLGYTTRLLPERFRYGRCIGAALSFLLLSRLRGDFLWVDGAALALGGISALILPYSTPVQKRLGRTGKAQVQLELVAGVLKRSEELIAQYDPPPVDVRGLLDQAVIRACQGCPNRKTCKQELALPEELISAEYPQIEDIPCRKPGRVLQELRHTQNQYRSLLGDNRRRQTYMAAIGQQYGFLAEYLQNLSDSFLEKRRYSPRFTPEAAVCSAGRQNINGDSGLWFPGTDNKFYMLLCDGMGTGSLAAKESRESAAILKRLLRSGYPVEHAMKSLNSLCYLREQSGIVTADLAEICLDSGKTSLYKWGACPSYLLRTGEVTPLGGSPTPVGISPQKEPEALENLHLRSGDVLVMLSDGIGKLPELEADLCRESPGEIAAAILSARDPTLQDDATVLVMRLNRI